MDLRQAQLTGGELTIRALAILGTVKVIVPDGIAVELTGMSIFGATTDRSHVEPHLVGAPVIRVKAWPIFGSVRILNQAPPGSLE